jgi:hypothetical protein
MNNKKPKIEEVENNFSVAVMVEPQTSEIVEESEPTLEEPGDSIELVDSELLEEGHPGKGEDEVQAELDAEDGGTIGFAVRKMRQGFRVARKGWGFLNKGIYLEQASGQINVPHVLMEDVSGRVFVWDINQSDLLAVDWHVIE